MIAGSSILKSDELKVGRLPTFKFMKLIQLRSVSLLTRLVYGWSRRRGHDVRELAG